MEMLTISTIIRDLGNFFAAAIVRIWNSKRRQCMTQPINPVPAKSKHHRVSSHFHSLGHNNSKVIPNESCDI